MIRFSSKKVALAIAWLIGVMLGLGAYTFNYAQGLSYFSTLKACANCHIMHDEYNSWRKSSHHANAVCVDCHLPRSLVPKLIAKADNGYRHSKGFTLQDFHQPILINQRNAEILQENCVRCHADTVHELVSSATSVKGSVRCVHCHAYVGHGPRANQ